jgi:hypothetical protein
MFFASGLRSAAFSLLATHPPLEERIRRLDPNMVTKGAPAGRKKAQVERAASGGRGRGAAAGTMGFAGGSAVAGERVGTGTARGAASSAGLIGSVGAPQPEHVAYAGRLMRSLPEPVLDAAHEPEGATALLFALLFHDGESKAGGRQRAMIAGHGGDGLLRQASDLAAAVRPLGPAARLPLLDVLLPALRELTPEPAARVRATAELLVEADGRLDMFELALMHVLGRQLAYGNTAGRTNAAKDAAPSVFNFRDIRDEAGTVLSAVAWSGAADEAAAAASFAAGAQSLPKNAGDVAMKPRAAAAIDEIDRAFERIRHATPPIRRRFLEACIHTVAHDGEVQVQEAELLRAVAEAIDCPMPPILTGAIGNG